MTTPHETPMDLEKILGALEKKKLNRAVIVKAQYSPDPAQVERTLIFSENGRLLRKVIDAWLVPETYQEILRQLSDIDVTVGSCSAMYSTSPTYLWAVRGDELRVWKQGELVARFSDQKTHIRRRIFGYWSQNHNSRFDCVHAFLSKTWIRRGVSLERKIGGGLTVAVAKETMAFMDPTYDGLDVMCDASWTTDLAGSIAGVTGIPLKVDKDLR